MMNRVWYKHSTLLWPLVPFSWVFCAISALRRCYYQKKSSKICYPVPIIVVGNIVVGGSGKTPLIIALVKYLKQQGYEPAVISRGYGAHPSQFPHRVLPDQDPAISGDEPLCIARATGCPVIIDPKRTRAIDDVLKNTSCNVILSDDGLQHYKMPRDIEIVVIDGQRRLGNGFCLPAGPLREPASRLKTVDFVVNNGGTLCPGEQGMSLQPIDFVNIKKPFVSLNWKKLSDQIIHAVAGIGNNNRFFNQLRELGCEILEHSFPDHYAYKREDFDFDDQLAVVMTEKDAVKCKAFAEDNWWYLPVEAKLEETFLKALLEKLVQRKSHG